MKCLVTGAAGFLGSHLCERLIKDGHTVIGIDDLSTGRFSNIDSLWNNPNFHFKATSIMGFHFERLMKDVDWCFHLAAKADIVPSIQMPYEYHNVNVTGTINALEVARSAKVKRFIYAASSSCYGIPEQYPTPDNYPCDPKYPYALTKYTGEQYVKHWRKVYNLPTVSLRLFNVYGPRHRTSGTYGAVFGTFLAQLANNKPVTIVGDGKQKRDFTFVTDVVDAFVKAASLNIYGSFNIGSGDCYSINDLAKNLGASEVVHLPKRPGEPDKTFADASFARAILNWEPKVSFEEGCKIMKELIPKYKDAPVWDEKSIAKATISWFEYMGVK